jgi:hypothetical protein
VLLGHLSLVGPRCWKWLGQDPKIRFRSKSGLIALGRPPPKKSKTPKKTQKNKWSFKCSVGPARRLVGPSCWARVGGAKCLLGQCCGWMDGPSCRAELLGRAVGPSCWASSVSKSSMPTKLARANSGSSRWAARRQKNQKHQNRYKKTSVIEVGFCWAGGARRLVGPSCWARVGWARVGWASAPGGWAELLSRAVGPNWWAKLLGQGPCQKLSIMHANKVSIPTKQQS